MKINNGMKGARIFISGGAGVIGRELVLKLNALEAIIMVGDLKPRPLDFPGEINYWHGDLNDITFLEINDFKPQIFIHLAATFERTQESKDFWEENFRHNMLLSHWMMTLIKDIDSVRKVVFASSYLIYKSSLYQFSKPQKNPISLKESDSIEPRNLTGMAKLAHECELNFLSEHYNEKFSTVIVRIFRGYGINSRDVISRWVRSLINNNPIEVYGEQSIFDYIYSKDTAEGLTRIASSDYSGILNLGSGKSRKVLDVINILKKHFPQAIINNNVVRDDYLYESSQADNSILKSFFKWEPEYDLEKSIPEIIDFEKKSNNISETVDFIPKLLITSASSKASLITFAQRGLKKINLKGLVVAGDIDKECIAQYIADSFWLMPILDDGLLEDIIKNCNELGINIILPTRDGELEFWSRHKKKFEEHGIKVIVSDLIGIKVTLDKLAFSNHGLMHKLKIIKSSKTISDIKSKYYVVKERFGAGSISMGLKLMYDDAIEHSRKLKNPIFQEYVEGQEFSFDAWLDSTHHKVKGYSLRFRNVVKDGESQITTTHRDKKIEKKLIHILETLSLSGPVVLQFILDKNQDIHVIECNARFGGASTAGIKVGVDSLYWSCIEALNFELDEQRFIRVNYEVKQIRIKKDLYVTDPSL